MFHHKLLRRLLALICALALCLGLSGPVSAAGDVYFSVVNDSMITLSDSTMPVWSGGVLYVPHSVFDGTNSTKAASERMTALFLTRTMCPSGMAMTK